MAREIRGVATPGVTLYARILNSSGQWWNGTTFETYVAGNWSTYDVAMTEQGSSGVFVADFPTAITSNGTYECYVHQQAGGSPAEGDAVVSIVRLDWTGSSSISGAATGSMSGSDYYAYVLRKGFKRTDKSTEVYEAITDAIQFLRRRFGFSEAQTEQETTDQIVLGEYKLDIESDFGMVIGIKVEDGTTGIPLDKMSKADFDAKYPFQDADTNFDGFPVDYCIFGNQILIGPRPDSASYNYRIAYSQRAGTVTSSTAGVPFTNLYRDILTDLVYHFLYSGLDEFDKSDRFKQNFENEYPTMLRRERKNGGEGTFCVEARDI